MQLMTKVREARVGLSRRRTERVAHRRLAAELASFVTPAERNELDQLLGRHTPEETREIRAILTRQELDRQHRSTPVGGFRV